MVLILILIVGLIFLFTGLYIFKNKKFKLGYYLFYFKRIENYCDESKIKNKDYITELISMTFIIIGAILVITEFTFFVFKFEYVYLLIPVGGCFIYYLIEMFAINKKLSE
ncbi:hypothetical protein [Clostridium sp. LIBA-8841]|uniref:hypothetical protein n=1 Tax=Clostridium sp. LIBA-8841 TaxID=2987530 RepID=UPI002AC7A7D7|nr:hypothetical protein [Clostridium sp. LIBA-8841]MDZ5253955.1 hypothetical protein [Clostridium sp. LIBA-8841]